MTVLSSLSHPAWSRRLIYEGNPLSDYYGIGSVLTAREAGRQIPGRRALAQETLTSKPAEELLFRVLRVRSGPT